MRITKKDLHGLLFLFLLISFIALLFSIKPTITGLVTGPMPEYYIGEIPEQGAVVGTEFAIKIIPNIESDIIRFSDDTKLFNITQEGVISFTPSEKDIGEYYVAVIIKDKDYNPEYQIVRFEVIE